MPRLTFPGVKLADVLRRLGEAERQVCLTDSTAENGWVPRIAWNPIGSFQSSEADTSGLEAFARQNSGQLIVGYLAYDFGLSIRGMSSRHNDDLGLPLIMAFSFGGWLEFDGRGATASNETFAAEVERILERPERPATGKTYSKFPAPVSSRQWYHEAFRQTQAHIRAGDIYQINLAHRLEGATGLAGRDLFDRLNTGSQAGLKAYMEAADFEVLSYSPERFVSIKDGQITTSPIKGTRPRGHTESEDSKLKAELLGSVKERAELDMITDLMRNDLGEICEVGSVQVTDKRALTAYPALWHTHSTITGQLRPELSAVGALAALMPGGSISGCPKKRAMQVIDEVEAKRRGLFIGTIFTIDSGGNLDSSILIRTIVKQAGKLYASIANGIIYDSDEAAEYQELEDKAVSFLGSRELSSDM